MGLSTLSSPDVIKCCRISKYVLKHENISKWIFACIDSNIPQMTAATKEYKLSNNIVAESFATWSYKNRDSKIYFVFLMNRKDRSVDILAGQNGSGFTCLESFFVKSYPLVLHTSSIGWHLGPINHIICPIFLPAITQTEKPDIETLYHI